MIDPNPMEQFKLAIEHHQAGRLEEAERICKRILELQPNNADAMHMLGVIAFQIGGSKVAIQLIGKAILTGPVKESYFINLGEALRAEGKWQEAIDCYRRLLAVNPGYAVAHFTLGNVLGEVGEHEEAIDCYRRAIAIDADYSEAENNLGVACQALGRLNEALDSYRRVIAINAGHAEAHNNLGNVLADLGRLDEAAAGYRRAIEANPGYAEAHCNYGTLLADQVKLDEAAACYGQALRLNPNYVEAHNNLANVFCEQDRVEEAAAGYRRALDIDPDYLEARYNLGNVLTVQGRLEEAEACYRRVLDAKPEDADAIAQLFHLSRQTCSWRDLEELTPKLDRATQEALAKGEKTKETPFISIARTADPSRNLAVAGSWSRDIEKRMSAVRLGLAFDRRRRQSARITIAYVSGNFSDHPTAHNTCGIYGLHNRDDFEVLAYSFGKDDGSGYRRWIRESCDAFVDIRDLGPAQAARRIHGDGVDILIGLTGHTRGSRLEICYLRPAPVQVAYLVFPGTSGGGIYDYILSDRVVTPEDEAVFHSEELVYLPHSYWPTDNKQKVSGKTFRKADFELPEKAFVYCSFNQTYKLDPVMFGVWMEILGRVPGGVLWLFRSNRLAETNLKKEAEARGIGAERLIFIDKLPKEEHLSRLKLADLVLDTRIYNGHTTTSDALWVEVPVITLRGRHFASRVSASILKAIGMEELITENLEDYRDLAVDLAKNPLKLKTIRETISRNRLTTPLFDTPGLVNSLEQAYKLMWANHLSGNKPAPITLTDD